MDLSSLNDLEQVVGKYAANSNLLVAAGPLAGVGVLKMVVGKSKIMNIAMVGSGVWFAVKEVSGPTLGLIQDQFGNLQQILGSLMK